jgi:DNA-binding response OmpR family regulator
MRILIVEDENPLSELIQEYCADLGYAVDAAFSGEEAEEKYIGFFPYDLFVLDIGLPGKDGFEVCRTIRALSIISPILILTGRADINDKVKGLDCGADDYMIKPFAYKEFGARIRALLRRQDTYVPSPDKPEPKIQRYNDQTNSKYKTINTK